LPFPVPQGLVAGAFALRRDLDPSAPERYGVSPHAHVHKPDPRQETGMRQLSPVAS